MKITPALPNPYQLPTEQDRQAIGAVRAGTPARDAADDPDRRRGRVPSIDPVERERLMAHAEDHLQRYPNIDSPRAQRALASYTQVAGGDQRRDLHDLLGFDAYA